MTPYPRLLRCLAVLLALTVLGGCQSTRFESHPAGTEVGCDQAWVGSWQIDQLRADGSYEDIGLLDVAHDCTSMLAHVPGKPSEDLSSEYGFDFSTIGDMRVLVVTPKRAEKPGVLLFRYRISPQRIDVRDIDHRHVAQRILGGSLAGSSELENRLNPGEREPAADSIDNYIAGDATAIAALLHDDAALFASTPWLILHRQPPQEAEAR